LNNIRIFSNTKSDKNTDVAVEKKKKVKPKSLTLTWRSKKKNRKEERHQDENANVWEDMKQAGLSVTLVEVVELRLCKDKSVSGVKRK